jgi:ABC-2 type transport system ATP-binding protein
MIQIKNLHKSYGSQKVLDDISLSLERGTTYALLGKNGAGKTTLINLIIDLIQADEGSIQIDSVPHNQLSSDDKCKLGIVGEQLALIEELNSREYLKFVGKIYGLTRSELETRINDLLQYFFEDEKDLQKNISKFSTGMKKKIAFCAAVIHTPEILILDEPFSGLDPLAANQMIAFLKQYANAGRLLFISSHDLSYVEKIATHIGVLNSTHLEFNSSLQDFTENGSNTLDSALVNMLQPDNTEQTKIDWV